MKRTTVEEFNDKGQLIKKTVTEEGAPYGYTQYYGPYWNICTCGTTWCPLHQSPNPTWTITSGNTADKPVILTNTS
jgi:hypothetical protein